MLEFLRRQDASRLIAGVAKAAVAVALLSILGAQYVSDTPFDQRTLSRLAGEASRAFREPMMTGAIPGGADRIKLDPCMRS